MNKFIHIIWADSQEWLEKVDNERVFAGHDSDVFVREDLIEQDSKHTNKDLRDKMIELIKNNEKNGGINFDEIFEKIPLKPNEEHYTKKQIENMITKLLEEGVAFEPRPQKIRYLG